MRESEIRPQALFDRFLALSQADSERFFADRSSFVDVDCPGCGSRQPQEAFEKLGFEYVLCSGCGTLYVSPRPPLDLIDAYYRNGEAARFWASSFYRETEAARRDKIYRPRAQLVAEVTASALGSGSPTIADIGAGAGILLEEVSSCDPSAELVAIEPSPELARTCREKGFAVVEQAVEEVASGHVQADVATAFEVLEHVFDAVAFLRGARRVLRPDGLLLLTTLTISGFDLQVLWDRSKSIAPPHHLNFVSIEAFPTLLRNAGFEMVEISTPGRLDVDIVGNMYDADPELPIPRFVRYLLEHRDASVRSEFQAFLQEARLSSHVQVIARRAE